MTSARACLGALVLLMVLCACAGGDPDSDAVRGPGLHAAQLSSDSRARAYEAAVRTAFDLEDPAVSILIDDRLLPRTAGLDSAATVPAAVVTELSRRAVVRGACRPKIGIKGAPKCKAALPGYVVRFSDVLAAGRDTAQVYMWAEKYDNANSGFSAPLRFERAYQLIKTGAGWRAAQEARIPVS